MEYMQTDIWNKVASSVNFTLDINYHEFQKYVPVENSVLDFGCGYGRIMNDLFDLGYEKIVGLDSSPEMIVRGKANYPHLSLHNYNSSKIPAPDNHYDAIMCCAVLTCIPTSSAQNEIVSELKRVLKNSGIIYFAEFLQTSNRTYGERGTFKTGFGAHMKHFTKQELLDLVADFRVISSIEKLEKSISGKNASSFQLVVKS